MSLSASCLVHCMLPCAKALTIAAALLAWISVADRTGGVTCLEEHEETSLVQLKQTVKHRSQHVLADVNADKKDADLVDISAGMLEAFSERGTCRVQTVCRVIQESEIVKSLTGSPSPPTKPRTKETCHTECRHVNTLSLAEKPTDGKTYEFDFPETNNNNNNNNNLEDPDQASGGPGSDPIRTTNNNNNIEKPEGGGGSPKQEKIAGNPNEKNFKISDSDKDGKNKISGNPNEKEIKIGDADKDGKNINIIIKVDNNNNNNNNNENENDARRSGRDHQLRVGDVCPCSQSKRGIINTNGFGFPRIQGAPVTQKAHTTKGVNSSAAPTSTGNAKNNTDAKAEKAEEKVKVRTLNGKPLHKDANKAVAFCEDNVRATGDLGNVDPIVDSCCGAKCGGAEDAFTCTNECEDYFGKLMKNTLSAIKKKDEKNQV